MDQEIAKIREEIILTINTYLISTEQLKQGFKALLEQQLSKLLQAIETQGLTISQLKEEIENLKKLPTDN